jgi:hypothetical protein
MFALLYYLLLISSQEFPRKILLFMDHFLHIFIQLSINLRLNLITYGNMALFNYHMIKKKFHLYKNFLLEKVNIYNIQIHVFN